MQYVVLCFGMSFFIVTVSMWTLEVDVLWREYGVGREGGIGSFEGAQQPLREQNEDASRDNKNLQTVCEELTCNAHGEYLTRSKLDALDAYKYSPSSPLFDTQAIPFFKTFTTRRCELAVVVAGAPRTGSTLLTRITEDCLERLSKHLNVKYKSIGYWRYVRHIKGSPEEDMESMVKVLDSIEPDVQVLVLKSHEYDPEIFKLCQKTLVITSTKDTRQLLKSAIGAKWIRQNNCTQLRTFLQHVLHDHRCWQRYAQLRFHYNTYASAKRITAISIMTKLAEILNLAEATLIADDGPLSSFPVEYMQEDANPTIPGGKGKEVLLDCELEEFPEFTS